MKIIYFASLKENLNTSHDEISVASPVSVAIIKKQLIEKYGDQHFPDNILCAVNHEMAMKAPKFVKAMRLHFFHL